MIGSGCLFDDRAGTGHLALYILCTGHRDRGLVEKDGLSFQVLCLCDHCLLADLVCDLVTELAFDHELADDVGVELEWRHGFGGRGGTEVEFMGRALFLRTHWKEGISDVDTLRRDWRDASGREMKLTGFSPNSNDSGGLFGNASRASSVSADMRTIMARFGFDWTAFELTWRERGALSGSGMMGEQVQESSWILIRYYKLTAIDK